ncbi:MAG: hypothetical protein HY320_00520 [Armatimonadetes bacterium]|nr:hypothetical protein [Armatimonadota bacterium]
MYTPLGEAALNTGQRLECGVVLGPDAEWRDRILALLNHKGPEWAKQIRRSLEGPLDHLETRFYIGCTGGRIITHLMIAGARGAGILGHVYTIPEERRKGACTALMARQMAHTLQVGYRVLVLGTGFESPPYWIYHSFGFRSIAPGRGEMKWLAEPDAEAHLFRSAPVRVRDLRWDDWPWVDLLGRQPPTPDEELPRSPLLGLKEYGSLEGLFCFFQMRRGDSPEIQARALTTESGSTVGWAILGPDARWYHDVLLLDLYIHPHFTAHAGALLDCLEWPTEKPVVAYTTGRAGWKSAALAGVGFQPATQLEGWLRFADGRRNLVIWRR